MVSRMLAGEGMGGAEGNVQVGGGVGCVYVCVGGLIRTGPLLFRFLENDAVFCKGKMRRWKKPH